jgi:SAM-dependent methyltransferase
MHDTATDTGDGQARLEEHYAAWFAELERDFRGSSLNQLVASWVTPGRVLDIGCGSGGLSAELGRRGSEVTSQDVSDKMVTMCRAYLERRGLPNGRVRRGGYDAITEVDHFDSLVALDVIEHIEDDRAALAAFRRALKPTGRLVLSVPALSALYGPKDEAIGHYRRYDKRPLLALIEQSGFRIEKVRYWNFIGVLPVWYTAKVRKKPIDESFRYASRSRVKRALNDLLATWFRSVENPVPLPLGLTLLVRASPTGSAPP